MAELEITTGLIPFCFEKNGPVPLEKNIRYCPSKTQSFRVYSVPNNSSTIRFDRFKRNQGAWVSTVRGCEITNGVTGALKADFGTSGKDDAGIQLDISADMSNSIYGASDTVQVAGIFVQCLILTNNE